MVEKLRRVERESMMTSDGLIKLIEGLGEEDAILRGTTIQEVTMLFCC